MSTPRKIAVLTSGGDAPGMNACVRAVVRTTLDEGGEVFGVRRGFQGLVEGDIDPLGARDVGGIIQQGGTVLGSARCPAFHDPVTQRRAYETLRLVGIEGLVVIGGDGSQRGGMALGALGMPVVGVASTIDDDLWGAEPALGMDSALTVALEAIDRLKVTAGSHARAFLVEVMGRRSGKLALAAAIGGGAEFVVLPEIDSTPDDVAAAIRQSRVRGKAHAIVVVSEGAAYRAEALVAHFEERQAEVGFELRATILGHVQRGATPTAFDRLLGSRLGHAAALGLLRGESNVVYGLQGGRIHATGLEEAVSRKKPLPPEDLELARCLAAH